MGQITVYKFKARDDELSSTVPRRWGTLAATAREGQMQIESTARNLDTSELDGNGFYPKNDAKSLLDHPG